MPDKNNSNKKNKKTRWEILKQSNSELIKMPELEHGEYLVSFLFEIGPLKNNGFGFSPLSYSDIKDWAIMTKTNISSWESRMLVFMSLCYVAQYNNSSDPVCPPPYIEKKEIQNEIRANVDNKFKMLLRSRKKR